MVVTSLAYVLIGGSVGVVFVGACYCLVRNVLMRRQDRIDAERQREVYRMEQERELLATQEEGRRENLDFPRRNPEMDFLYCSYPNQSESASGIVFHRVRDEEEIRSMKASLVCNHHPQALPVSVQGDVLEKVQEEGEEIDGGLSIKRG